MTTNGEEIYEDQFSTGKQISSGSEGIVYLREHDIFGPVAVKMFFEHDRVDLTRRNEIESIAKNNSHQNIVRFFGSVFRKVQGEPVIVGYAMEYMPGGSLSSVIHSTDIEYNDSQIYNWGRQATSALQYLHKRKIAHMDVKPSNILLANDWILKICDFGTTREMCDRSMTLGTGSTPYMSPELINHDQDLGRYNEKCDVYSMGVVLWEIITRRKPFSSFLTNYSMMKHIKRGGRPSSEEIIDPILRTLIERCFSQEPVDRPSMAEMHEILKASCGDAEQQLQPGHIRNPSRSTNSMTSSVHEDMTMTTSTLSELNEEHEKVIEGDITDSELLFIDEECPAGTNYQSIVNQNVVLYPHALNIRPEVGDEQIAAKDMLAPPGVTQVTAHEDTANQSLVDESVTQLLTIDHPSPSSNDPDTAISMQDGSCFQEGSTSSNDPTSTDIVTIEPVETETSHTPEKCPTNVLTPDAAEFDENVVTPVELPAETTNHEQPSRSSSDMRIQRTPSWRHKFLTIRGMFESPVESAPSKFNTLPRVRNQPPRRPVGNLWMNRVAVCMESRTLPSTSNANTSEEADNSNVDAVIEDIRSPDVKQDSIPTIEEARPQRLNLSMISACPIMTTDTATSPFLLIESPVVDIVRASSGVATEPSASYNFSPEMQSPTSPTASSSSSLTSAGESHFTSWGDEDDNSAPAAKNTANKVKEMEMLLEGGGAELPALTISTQTEISSVNAPSSSYISPPPSYASQPPPPYEERPAYRNQLQTSWSVESQPATPSDDVDANLKKDVGFKIHSESGSAMTDSTESKGFIQFSEFSRDEFISEKRTSSNYLEMTFLVEHNEFGKLNMHVWKLHQSDSKRIDPMEWLDNHDGILKFVGYLISGIPEVRIGYLMEHSESRNLKTVLGGKLIRAQFNMDQLLEFVVQAASALVWLESKGYYHKQVETSNMLITNNGNVLKLLCFGFLVERDGEIESGSRFKGAAVEIEEKYDVHRIGFILGEILFQTLKPGTKRPELLQKCADQSFLNSEHSGYAPVLMSCLDLNAKLRPTLSELYESLSCFLTKNSKHLYI